MVLMPVHIQTSQGGEEIKRSFNEIIQQLANGGLKYEENIGTLQALV